MGVEEFAPAGGDGVGLPDAGGPAYQIDFGDADGGDFVVVAMEGGVAANVGAFQHIGAATEGMEAAAELEAVGAGFHEEGVVGGAVAGDPVEEGCEGAVGVGFQETGVVEGGAS